MHPFNWEEGDAPFDNKGSQSANGGLAEVRFGAAALRLSDLLTKYRPDQLRVPAGKPTGGQWAYEGRPKRVAAKTDANREIECQFQLDRDIFHCKMVGLRACYEHAHFRYALCLRGHAVPPLNY